MQSIVLSRLLLSAIGILFSISSLLAQQEILYGVIQKSELLRPGFTEWYQPGYTTYQPNAAVMQALRKVEKKGISVDVWLGTWCGDSKREVPRFLKIIDSFAGNPVPIKIIALGGRDSLYKQSPGHEEEGKGIYRVPVFIVYKDGKEVGRINEYPVMSLEKDLLAILSGEEYIPNYKSFNSIKKWVEDGTLLDENNSLRGMANQLRSLVTDEYELNSLGYLFLRHQKAAQALRVFQLNQWLYSLSANVVSSLAEGYAATGNYTKAIQLGERALELNKDPTLVSGIVEMLYKAKLALANECK